MLKRIAPLAMAIGLALTFSSAAFAQAQECKPDISATGRAALTEAGAKTNATTNWRRDVVLRYGEFFGDFEKARDSSVRCAKTLMGLQRCEVRGRPCAVGASTTTSGSGPNGIPEIACTSKDSKNCEPDVKWIQSRLNDKGCKAKVDGAEGPGTAEALKCFQKQAKLSVTGEIDTATVDALRK